MPPQMEEILKVDERHRALAYTVHLGDIIAMMGGGGTGSDDLKYRLDKGFQQYIDLSINDLETILLFVEEEFVNTKSSLFHTKENSV